MRASSTAPLSVPLPLRHGTARRLAARGFELRPRADEGAEDFAARLETALMALFRDEREEEDFAALYEHAQGALLGWTAGLLGGHRGRLDPRELVQDTFVNVYRYAQGFREDGPRSFRVWSRTIAGNVVRRARAVRLRSFHDLPEGLQEPRDVREGPAEEMVRDEDGRCLAEAWLLLLVRYAAAYERLSARDQLALDLVELQGLPYAEACRRLGVGLSNLKMILFRARRRIRAAIARDLGCELGGEEQAALRQAG